VLVRVLMAGQEPVEALRLLERLDALATAQGRTDSLIETRALRSLATQAAGITPVPPQPEHTADHG
jgi:hypothetical protein